MKFIVFLMMIAAVVFAAEPKNKKTPTANKANKQVTKQAEAKQAPQKAADKPAETKPAEELVFLTTVERAFLKTLATRDETYRYLVTESAKLKTANENDKKAIEANIATASRNLEALQRSMDIIFGIGNRRNYEYNPTSSTIYLKVGNVNETFARALQGRAALTARVIAVQEAYKKETDDAKKRELERQNQVLSGALDQMANALFMVYQIHPKRQYQFDAKTGAIYVKATQAEVENLRKQTEALKAK